MIKYSIKFYTRISFIIDFTYLKRILRAFFLFLNQSRKSLFTEICQFTRSLASTLRMLLVSRNTRGIFKRAPRRSTRENLYWQGSRTVIRKGRCKILKGLCTKSTIYACILHWEYFWSIFFFKHNTILANRKKQEKTFYPMNISNIQQVL